MSDAIRLFAALEPSEPVKTVFADWSRNQLDQALLRPLSASQLHLTLVFLGSIPAERVSEVEEVLGAACGGLPGARLEPRSELVGVPKRRPRLLAVEFADRGGAAAALQDALAGGFAAAGLHEPEERDFWPHMTVARVRRAKRGPGPPVRLRRPFGDLPEGLCEPFDAVRVSLYRSDLRPDGASYARLATYELPPPAAEGE